MDPDDLRGDVSSALLKAEDCPDLLTKIQDDAAMKVQLAALRAKIDLRRSGSDGGGNTGGNTGGGGFADAGVAVDSPVTGGSGTGGTSGGGDDFGGNTGGAAPPSAPVSDSDGSSGESAGGGSQGGGTRGPTGASDTNTQVEGVDEADFVKVVQKGERMFVLHGSSLFALDSWPAAETKLSGESLKVEGSPSEMFVTADGKRAVIFSSVYSYGGGYGGYGPEYGDCYDCGYGGATFTKVTIADVSTTKPSALRELYYEGNYLSSRRYESDSGNVVRAVFQGYSRHGNLFYPQVEYYDAWGRRYSNEVIDGQLDEWVARSTASIRATKLEDWLPIAQEAVAGKIVDVEPACDSFYMPPAGLSDYGLTHVLSVDIDKADAKVGGVTIMGAASTVYSNTEHLVLAQPDYRWGAVDFGIANEQRTALHMFGLTGASTDYLASGWVSGHVPSTNSQFAIDEKDGAIRVATTGWVRDNPDAKPEEDAFWRQHPENYVFAARPNDNKVLAIVGKSDKLGKPNETIRAARFVGDRGYVVTAVQTDPLYVLDLKDPTKISVLGEIEIPGFSEYVHPLDENHLITVGQNASNWGIQLQLFDVTNPKSIPQPKVLDFGDGSSSEASYQHKAFTFYEKLGLLAVPLYQWNSNYSSTLQVIKVDADKGFTALGAVDHTSMFAQQNCGVCDERGCYEYYCSYAPEMRRGHFVEGDDATFVYSFSYAGVKVNNLSNLSSALATVLFPQPQWNNSPWYEGLGGGDSTGGGGSVGGSNTGGWGGEPGRPPSVDPAWPADAGVEVDGAWDAGSPVSDADGGAAMTP
jgi:hypothetical protein